jgi:non-specific serine/threonine protein kinase
MSTISNKISQLWQELRRRKVVPIFIAYLATSLAVIEFLDISSNRFAISDNTFNLLYILAAIGLPLAVILPWYINSKKQEITPDVSSLKSESSPIQEKSIIVLPFENISPDPDQEYFSDGLTEEIITDLSHIHDLLVISRSSAMTFKGIKKKIREIASDVNVRYVLEGSVRKAGNDLRITAQLIDASNDNHLWAEKYNGTLDDVFDIQEKVSRSIADALTMKLSPETRDRIMSPNFTNIQAFEFYLKARHEIFHFREESMDKALEYLDKGLHIVGDNELLYKMKSIVYVQYVNFLSKPPYLFEEMLLKAQKNASKALETNPNSAEAHFAQGATFSQYGDPKGAIEHFRKAVSIDPNNSDANYNLGYHYAAAGFNKEEAWRLVEKAIILDPMTKVLKFGTGLFHFFYGNYGMMIEEINDLQKVLKEIKSPFIIAIAWLHAVYQNFDEALRLIDNFITDKPDHVMSELGSFMKYAYTGEKEIALKSVSEKLKKAAWWDDAYSFIMTECYSLLGEKDMAFQWFDRALDYGITNPLFLSEYNPFLENLRSDKMFQDCMDKASRFVKSLEHE